MKKLILALVLFWPVAGLADLVAGLEAYIRGDYATAMQEFRPLAEAGDAKAQHRLGIMYANGEGVPEDDAEAVRWYRMAAEQGNVSAQFNLGLMYVKGEGVPKDHVQAYAWYNLAAVQGDEGASLIKDLLHKRMTPTQIAEAQKLRRDVTVHPNGATDVRPNGATTARDFSVSEGWIIS